MLNKVDLLADGEQQRVERQFKKACQHTRVFSTSALMRQRTDELVSRMMTFELREGMGSFLPE